MDFSINNRPKLPRNRYGWIGFTGTGSSSRKGGSGLDSKTLNSLYDLIDWFYRDSSGNIHARYDFCGDGEVAAYSMGPGGNIQGYNTDWIDASYIYILDLIDQLDLDISIDGSIDLTDFAKRNWVQNNFPDNSSVSATYVKNVSFNSYIETLNSSINEIEKWWWLDGSTINTSFHIVGHGEVNAYGQGPGAETDSYTQQHIDTSYNYIINLIDNISIGGGGEGGTYITDVSISQWDNAANLAHTHGNKAILDGITDSSISMWNETAENLNDWFYLDVSGNLNTSLNLIGHQEIMAWGKGESADADGSIQQHIDASYAELVQMIQNIDIDISIDGSIDLSDYAKKDWVQDNYPDNASVWDNYVHNSSLSTLDTSLHDMDGRLDTFESWFYKDASGFIHCSSTFISDYELCAYGIGDSSEINIARYVTGEYLEEYYYSKSEIDELIAAGIDGSIDLNGYVTKIYLEANYPDNSSVWDNYVHNVSLAGLDSSLSEINTSINDISSRVNTFEGWFYKDASGFIHCSSTFISDYELAAYGMGQQGGEIVLSDYVLNVSLVENYYNKQDISNMIHNVSFDNYPTNSSVFTNYAHKSDLNDYVEKTVYNTAVQEINTSINDISTRLANNTSLLNKTNSSVNTFEKWFYKDEHGYIHCSSTFISDYEIAAYGQGTSAEGEIVLTNYVTNVSLVENYYNKQDISNIIQNVSFDNYPTNSSVFTNYAHKSDLNDYVEKSVYNPAVQNINTSILDISTRLSDVSGRLKSTDSSVKEFSRWFWKDSSGNIHCSANFIGEHEVAAFGAGQSGGEINLQGYAKWIDVSYNYYNKSEIDQRFNTIELDDYVKVSTFNASTANINASIITLKNRIANVSQGVNNANASIVEVSTRLKNLTTRVDNHDTSLTQLNNNLKSTDITVTDLSTRMKTAEGRITDVSSYAISVNTKLDDYFWKDNSGVHCRYNFIGEHEVAAFGAGQSGGEINLQGYAKWVDISSNYYNKNEIDQRFNTIELDDYVKVSTFNASTANINASIITLKNRIANVSQGVITINNTINTIQSDIQSLNTTVSQLDDHIYDVQYYAENISTRLKSTNSTVASLETRIKNVSSYAISVSTRLGDWFYFENGKLYTKYDFISEKEICAYKDGSSGQSIDYSRFVDSSTLNNYYTKREVDAVVANKMDSFDLSDYATKNWVNSSLGNYAKKTDLDIYVKKTTYNTAVNKLNSSVNLLETRVKNVEDNFVSNATWNSDRNRQDTSIKLICSSIGEINTSIGRLNTSIGRIEEWFTLDSAGNVHCTKPFIGNHEVAAYGQGSGSGGGSEIDLSGYVSVATMNSSWVPYFNQKYFYPGKDIEMTNRIIAGDIYALEGDLYTDNDLRIAGNTLLNGSTRINSSLYVKNNVSVGKNLSVSEKSTLTNVSIGSNGNISMDSSKPILKIGKPYSTTTGNLNASIIFGDTAKGSINVYRKQHKINNASVYRYDMDIFTDYLMTFKAANVSINAGNTNIMSNTAIGGNLSLDSSRVRLNIGKRTNTEFDSSIRFYDGLSYIKVGADVGDMTIYSGDQITLNCPADSGGVHIKGGYLNLDSQTSQITIGPTPTSNYNSSIIFGNTGMGYIRSYYNNNKKNLYIKGGDILTLDAGEKISFVKDLTLDTDIVFSDGGNILGAGTIHCEDLIYDSDRRLKKNIRPLEFKGGLTPVEFDMVKTSRHSIGFVAQEVAEKYPQVVHENKDGYLSLDYPKITAILSAQVNYLEDKIARLEQILNDKGLI